MVHRGVPKAKDSEAIGTQLNATAHESDISTNTSESDERRGIKLAQNEGEEDSEHNGENRKAEDPLRAEIDAEEQLAQERLEDPTAHEDDKVRI